MGGDGAVGLVTGPHHWVFMFLAGWSFVAMPLAVVVPAWVWLVQKHPVLDARPASALLGIVGCALVATALMPQLGRIWPGEEFFAGPQWLFLPAVFFAIVVYLLLPRVLISSLGTGALLSGGAGSGVQRSW